MCSARYHLESDRAASAYLARVVHALQVLGIIGGSGLILGKDLLTFLPQHQRGIDHHVHVDFGLLQHKRHVCVMIDR